MYTLFFLSLLSSTYPHLPPVLHNLFIPSLLFSYFPSFPLHFPPSLPSCLSPSSSLFQFLANEQRASAAPGLPNQTSKPYHYGSHYSNSGIVLHFLVRLPPFTEMFLAFQGEL